ncbi:MAG: hypothetical protein M3017_14525 [Actinomycetota bacterium]|nr:hypothetical protein [Actinomycetota bacterium]
MAPATAPDSPAGTPAAELFHRAEEAALRSEPEAEDLYLQTCIEASRTGRLDLLTDAALRLIGRHRFGTPAGRLPALLHRAYRAAEDTSERGRLAAALARLWVYSGEAARAVAFADDALRLAEDTDNTDDLADALEASLLVRWGPQDVSARAAMSTRLAELTAYSEDLELRLRALCWVLTSALERLDALGVDRQLRELDLLASQSGSARVMFYALSRRAMVALLAGRTEEADALRAEVSAVGRYTGDVDAFAIDHALLGEIARQRGTPELLAAEAALFEEAGRTEGVPSILAQAALLWLEAGDPERAARLARHVAGADFSAIPPDVDWLLTACTVTEVACRTEDTTTTALLAGLLEPFAGQGVVNAGAVTFHGVVDHYLGAAALLLGNVDRARPHLEWARAAYARLGADWWISRLPPLPASVQVRTPRPAPGPPAELVLHPADQGIWRIGPEADPKFLPGMKGFDYLRHLVRNPGREISCLDLAAAFAPEAQALAGAGGTLLDERAKSAYKHRLAELEADVEEASEWNDPDRVLALRQERQALIDQLAQAYGLLGRARTFGSDPERARVAVRKAVAAALDRIAAADPATGSMLRGGVHTGRFCRYDPDADRPVRWRTRP